jgi:hypothetical protein
VLLLWWAYYILLTFACWSCPILRHISC